MVSSDDKAKPFQRSPFWFLKFLFACYGGALALFMVAIVLSLPFGGPQTLGEHGGIVMLGFTIVVSPFVYRYLR